MPKEATSSLGIIVIQEEVKTIENNLTWNLVSLPSQKIPIIVKWIYKVNYFLDYSIDKHRAWLVAKGFLQNYNLDLIENFESIARIKTNK